MDTQRLLRDEDDAWRDLHETFAAIPRGRLEEPGLTPEEWSVKDVMFHIGAWLAECGKVLEQIRMGTYRDRDLTVEEIDRKNREWFECSRLMDLHTVRAELESARVRARAEFGSLPEMTKDAWEWFEESGPIHYAEHLKDLRAWLG